MNKLDQIEEILSWYGKSIKINENDYISTCAVFETLAEVWGELKAAEKLSLVDILFD